LAFGFQPNPRSQKTVSAVQVSPNHNFRFRRPATTPTTLRVVIVNNTHLSVKRNPAFSSVFSVEWSKIFRMFSFSTDYTNDARPVLLIQRTFPQVRAAGPLDF
jgi:hypothetical protein